LCLSDAEIGLVIAADYAEHLTRYETNGTAIGWYRQIAEQPGFIPFRKTL
jgi:hypothetical protein